MYCLLFPYHCVLNKIDWCPANGIQVVCTRSQDAMPFHKNKSSGGACTGGLTLSIDSVDILSLFLIGGSFRANSPKILKI